MKLTTEEFCRVAEISRGRLDRWAEIGVLEGIPDPQDNNRRIYSASQCLAIATAVKYADAGAAFENVVGIGQLLRKMPLECVEAELAAGRTYPIPCAILGLNWLPGTFVEMPKAIPANVLPFMERIHLPTIFTKVRTEIEKLVQNYAQTPRGRRSLVTR